MLDRLFTMEQVRLLAVSVLSPVLAVITPTNKFTLALVIMAAWNIWAGMRADGVVIHSCKNFNTRKFWGALRELALYVAIIWLIHSVMVLCGDAQAAIVTIKTLSYVFMYVYLQNSFKNLIIAYPKNKALWYIYLVIRLEFKRLLPSHINEVMDEYEKHTERQKKSKTKKV